MTWCFPKLFKIPIMLTCFQIQNDGFLHYFKENCWKKVNLLCSQELLCCITSPIRGKQLSNSGSSSILLFNRHILIKHPPKGDHHRETVNCVLCVKYRYEHLNNFYLKSQLDYIRNNTRHTKQQVAPYFWSISPSAFFFQMIHSETIWNMQDSSVLRWAYMHA